MGSPTTISPYKYVYQNVFGVPEYTNFEFEVNWITVLELSTLLYSIPSIVVFIRILLFYVRNKENIRKSGLRIEIFQSFLWMQFWNIVSVVSEYLMLRVPSTSLLTSFCASRNPQLLMRSSVFLYYWSSVTSQLLTVVFCVLRVSILFLALKTRKKSTYAVTAIVILIGALSALPHLLTEGICFQLFEPYPFGSLVVVTQFYMENLSSFVLLFMFFTTCVTLLIVVLSVMMLMKIGQRKKQLSSHSRQSNNSKAEKTLTGTMIILLVPLVINQVSSLGQLFHFEVLSYILLFRSFFVDMRVHVVTVYFYMTHPVFRRKEVVTQTTISHTNARL